MLGPALEAAIDKRGGDAELVKVDTDGNPNLAMGFQIGSIPAVKAFRDGQVVGEFMGAILRLRSSNSSTGSSPLRRQARRRR